jgi:hypothetical protein
MGPRQVAPSENQGAPAPAISGLVSRETAAAGRPPLIIAEATCPGVFRGGLADRTIMNHAGAVDSSRPWAVMPPVRRKPSRAPSPPPLTDAPTARPSVVVITVSPSTGANGPVYSRGGQLFDGAVDGRLVVAGSTRPLLDACRVLIFKGIDPAARVVMRHAGSATDALITTVGAAAALTVEEGDGVARFRPWKPFSRWDGPPEIARSDRAAAVPPEMQTLSGEPARGSKGGGQ